MKRSILSILLIMVLVFSFSSTLLVSAFAEEDFTAAKGMVYINDNEVDDVDDVYYVNDTFSYKPGSTAVKYYVFATEYRADVKGLSPRDIIALAGASSTDVATHDQLEIEVLDTDVVEAKYYFFIDENEEGQLSEYTEAVLDNVAPVIDETLFAEWLTTEDSNLSLQQLPAGDDFEFNFEWVDKYDEDNNTSYVYELTAMDDGYLDASLLGDMVVEYASPSDASDSADWASSSTGEIDLDQKGQWVFRYVLKDMAGNEVTSSLITREVKLMTAPTITFSTTVLDYEEDGVTAGLAFTVPNPTAKDAFGKSLTATYVIYKMVNGEKVAIFDSATDATTEGYEEFVSGGQVTPGLNEVTDVKADTIKYIYSIEYTVADENGNTATKTLNIRVNEPTLTDDELTQTIWQWVLIGLSVLSAVAILILLISKPKKANESQLAPNLAGKSKNDNNDNK